MYLEDPLLVHFSLALIGFAMEGAAFVARSAVSGGVQSSVLRCESGWVSGDLGNGPMAGAMGCTHVLSTYDLCCHVPI